MLNIANVRICTGGLFPRWRHAHGNSQRAFTRSLPRSPLSLLPSPLPRPPPLLSSSPSPFLLLLAAAAHTHTHTHTLARTRTRSHRARLFPRRFRPPSQAPLVFAARAFAHVSSPFFTVVVVVVAVVATVLGLVLFPGLNSGNGTITPLGSTLPSPLLPTSLRLPAAPLRICCCCCCSAFLRLALSLGLNPKDGSRALATADSSLRSCAYCCCCCCCSCIPPILFLGFNYGDTQVSLPLMSRYVSGSFTLIITLLIISSLFPFLLQ